jgi:hypothetical protein
MKTERIPKLFIGPWIGEFGVELLRWQSIARTLARSREWSAIIVATYPDRFFLYQDFATKFIPHVPQSIHTIGHKCYGHRAQPIHTKHISVDEGDVWLDPEAFSETGKITERTFYPLSACIPTHRNFGKNVPKPIKVYDLLLHARATPKSGQLYKNWDSANFKALVEALPNNLRIASVGSVTGAHKIKGTDDLRGIPLHQLVRYCSTAKLMIGPSSGSIHFGMNCGLPVVTWIGENEKHNYYPVWNPQNVPVCCLSGWNPSPDVVHRKVHEMLRLIESRQHRVEMLVIGTKRSGHHGVIEWLSRFQPLKRFILWNDCVSEDMMSYPDEAYTILTKDCYPKQLHSSHSKAISIQEWNSNGRNAFRCLSFEGVPLSSVAKLPEAKEARKIILVVRDLANTAASLKTGIDRLTAKHFLHPDFRRVIGQAREYLREATGSTNWLKDFASKVVFVSYNRWHTDAKYRRDLAMQLGFGSRDVDRGHVSDYAHSSSFQERGTEAKNLDTLARWTKYAESPPFWNLVCDAETHALEAKFHGDAMPAYAKWRF